MVLGLEMEFMTQVRKKIFKDGPGEEGSSVKRGFSEVSQSSTDVGVMLLNAAVALSDKFPYVALDVLTIATQTDRQTDGRTDG